jgi:ubiquinone/menaquinone biosynthesis C-methylase UbiE
MGRELAKHSAARSITSITHHAYPDGVPQRTDYERVAAVYDAGRATPLETLEGWRRAITPLITGAEPILNLGAGTGIWAEALAHWFAVDVVAIEPSAAMRGEAVRKRSHRRIAYVGGRAEDLPLRDASCGCAWLSTVVHHFADVRKSARGLRRVLVPDASVLVRNAFSGRTGGVPWLRYWPDARPLAESRWPTVEAVRRAFGAAGWRVEGLESVTQQVSPSLRVYCERARLRADSTLAQLSDEDFDRGLAALERAVADQAGPRPFEARIDLLVLR